MKRQKAEGRKPRPRVEDREEWIVLCPRCEAMEFTMDDGDHRAVRCLRCGFRWVPVAD